MLHPANRLLAWGVLTLYLSSASFNVLIIMTTMIMIMAIGWVPDPLWRSLRRMRWLLVALMVTFAWSTPGVYFASSWYAPSVEGVYAGIEQVLRLISVLASLQIALKGMNQTMLLSACYQLSRPFTCFNGNTERFAVRLALTLQYAEQWLIGRSALSWRTLGSVFDTLAQDTVQEEGEVTLLPFSRLDRWISCGFVIGIVLLSIISIKVSI